MKYSRHTSNLYWLRSEDHKFIGSFPSYRFISKTRIQVLVF